MVDIHRCMQSQIFIIIACRGIGIRGHAGAMQGPCRGHAGIMQGPPSLQHPSFHVCMGPASYSCNMGTKDSPDIDYVYRYSFTN